MRRFAILPGAILLALAPGGSGTSRAEAPSLAEQQARLRGAKTDAAAAERRAKALENAAATERDQAAQARAQEAAAAERIRASQADIAAAHARIAIVDRLLRAQRERLAERQSSIANLVAALQSLARRPAVLGLIQPGSTADLVHVRAVLGTTLPVVEARTADVRAEIDRTRKLRDQGELAVRSLRDSRARLEEQRVALVRLEAEHRLRSQQLGRSALFESDRAIALGERARDIVDQMATMGTAAGTRASLESLPGPLPRPPRPGASETPSVPDPHRPPPYRLPAAGELVTGLGELADTGVRARGLTLAARPGAPVVAPAAGRVLFAGRFRDYGTIVIIDHGQGWTSLIAGLGGLRVKRGDTVAQGTPIGRVSAGDAPRVTVELRRRGLPIDMTPLLG